MAPESSCGCATCEWLTLQVSWHQKGNIILNFRVSRDDGLTVAVASTGSYANHLQLALDNHASISLLTQLLEANTVILIKLILTLHI